MGSGNLRAEPCPSQRACPGSFELPYAARSCAKVADAIICIGILIKGGTIHMEVRF